jgi:hypothetical protein
VIWRCGSSRTALCQEDAALDVEVLVAVLPDVDADVEVLVAVLPDPERESVR